MEVKKHKLLLFIFFLSILIMLFLSILVVIINLWNGNSVQAMSSDVKMEFEIIGNEEISKNGLFKAVVPDNGFEEWDKYLWENDILFSENIMHISGDVNDINMVKVFVSKELDKIKIKEAIKEYENAAKDGKYSEKEKVKINNIIVYYYERYNNIDTRKSYQFVFEKDNNIYYIEGSYRIGENEYFSKIIKQIILSIK